MIHRLGRAILSWGMAIGFSVLIWGVPSPMAWAAERVVVTYGVFGETIAVPDLEALVRNGDVNSGSVRDLLRFSGKSIKEIRKLLTTEVKTDLRFLDRALNSFVGEIVLEKLGEGLRTSSKAAPVEALRSALILSAKDDEKISLLEILQQFPTPELVVDGEQLAKLSRKAQRFVDKDLRETFGAARGALQGILCETPKP